MFLLARSFLCRNIQGTSQSGNVGEPMKNKSLYFSALSLSALIVLTACTASQPQDDAKDSVDHGMAHQMTSAPEVSSKDANAADMNFASGMKAHHEQAMEMSTEVLGKEQIPAEVQKVAEEIKSAQGPEIELMDRWLASWDMPEGMDHQQMDHGEAMVSSEDILKLKNAQGREAAKLFLEQMIQHHEGAVEMARTEIDQGSDPEAIKLSESIVESQNQEIQQMKDMLSRL
ncbi:DUF305 domain-containing protein [Glutamicibacter ectropisis]|uniref:DUF305 domain-containing protein n=1 Tax=Glutamicibacter ectropisis TaxID=3046593 RepID=A0AAU6WI48_9MICC